LAALTYLRGSARWRRSTPCAPVGASPPLLLVEQGYGVRDAGDEPTRAGKQQQFLDKPGHDVLPGSGSR